MQGRGFQGRDVKEVRGLGSVGKWMGKEQGILEKDFLLPSQNLGNARKPCALGNSLLDTTLRGVWITCTVAS